MTKGGNSDTYSYDANGNMTCRVEAGVTFIQKYNAENRTSSIIKLETGTCASPGNYAGKWDFAYDGDGVRTATLYTPYTSGSPGTPVLTTYYFGGLYEVTGSTIRKYYALAGQTVAMKEGSTLSYFLTDHLGSTLAVLDSAGAVSQQQRYLPFGQVRTISGSSSVTATDFGYTSQRNLSDMGLMDYRARFYSQSLGRFIQPDTIVPGAANPQAFNRYSYVYNDPINAIDPSGHYGGRVHEQRRWFYQAYGSHWQEHFRAWRNRGVKPPTCAELGCGPKSIADDGGGGGGGSGASGVCSAMYCSGLPFDDDGAISFAAGGSVGSLEDIFDTLAAIEELFNWSLTSPGEVTVYKDPGYPFLGGSRVFYQPNFTMDNGQPITIGPKSIGSGSLTLGFNSVFAYKHGLNSVSAIGINSPYLQPWSLKVSVDTKFTFGNASFTHRFGYEYTARPDNWAYVGAAAFIVATYGLGVRVADQIPWGRVPIPQQ